MQTNPHKNERRENTFNEKKLLTIKLLDENDKVLKEVFN